MFGLFKKKIGPEEFAKEIFNSFETLIQKAKKQYGNDEMLGAMVMMVFSEAEKDWKNNASKFARKYEISVIEVEKIIESCSKFVFSKYFEY